jgi:hypothetical protein
MYELVPGQLLHQFPTEILISSLIHHGLTRQQLERAARSLQAMNFQKRPQSELNKVTAELKKQLLRIRSHRPIKTKSKRQEKLSRSRLPALVKRCNTYAIGAMRPRVTALERCLEPLPDVAAHHLGEYTT